MISKQEFKQRRENFMALLPKNCVAVIGNNKEAIRKGDTTYPFSPDSNFYYLTGFTEMDAVAVFTIDKNGEKNYYLFTLQADPEKEVWTGKRVGQERVLIEFGVDEAMLLDEFGFSLKSLLNSTENIQVYYPYSDKSLHQLFYNNRISYHSSTEYFDIEPLLGELRLIKSSAEIELMQRAADISSQAHIQVMKSCKPNQYEYSLEAEFLYACIKAGARTQAYPPIVASGNNACTLHYETNDQQLKAGELVLMDAGCEYQYYCSDITRTYPINGKFSAPQKAIYELVLQTQLAIINLVKPGLKFNVLQETTVQLLTEGLVKLGILQGNVNELVAKQAYKKFYMHGVSHWLGLDTHDIGERKQDGIYRALQVGNVLTVEPGIYIAADNQDVDTKWRGIGVRIEDDVLVTETGYHVLSNVPKAVSEIEKLMAW